jgi:hypothetical protein
MFCHHFLAGEMLADDSIDHLAQNVFQSSECRPLFLVVLPAILRDITDGSGHQFWSIHPPAIL